MNTIKANLPESVSITLKYHGPQTIDLKDMSPEWLEWAIANGVRQSCADADAGKANTKDGEDAVLEKFSRIKAGNIPSGGGGGGARIDPLEKELRALVSDALNKAGMKRVDANKAAKDPKAAFRQYLEIALAAKYGEDGVSERIDDAFATNWPKLEDTAKARVEAAKTDIAI